MRQLKEDNMADDRKMFIIKENNSGSVKVADEVICIIAGLAATEVEGVTAMVGNIPNELISKVGFNRLSKGVNIAIKDEKVKIDLSVCIDYGFEIPAVSSKVQEKVKYAIENMTGLEVTEVNVHIASVEMQPTK